MLKSLETFEGYFNLNDDSFGYDHTMDGDYYFNYGMFGKKYNEDNFYKHDNWGGTTSGIEYFPWCPGIVIKNYDVISFFKAVS